MHVVVDVWPLVTCAYSSGRVATGNLCV